MRHFEFDGCSLDISEEIYSERKGNSINESDLIKKLRDFLRIDFRSAQKVIELEGLKRPQSMAMLEAHGCDFRDNYSYVDLMEGSFTYFPVKDWISSNDGKFDVLYLAVCNAGSHVPPRGKSHLIYPINKFEGTEIYNHSNGDGSGVLRVSPKI